MALHFCESSDLENVKKTVQENYIGVGRAIELLQERIKKLEVVVAELEIRVNTERAT